MGKNKLEIELKELLILFFSIFILIVSIVGSVIKSDKLLIGVFVVWTMIIIYTVTDIYNHIALFFYLISFFVFLIGREICFLGFGLERYYTYLEPYNRFTFLLLIASLVFVLIGYIYAGSRYKFSLLLVKRNRLEYVSADNLYAHKVYSKVCKVTFYICYIVSIISTLIQALYVKNSGYLDSYLSERNTISPIFSYVTAFSSIALCLYLATSPIKKSAIYALILYEIYGVLTMLTGHRYTFIAISMTVIIYVCIRNRIEGGWVTTKCIIAILIMIPFLIIFLLALDSIRVGGEFKFESWRKSIISFLDQQGGSVNVIKRIFYYKDEIKDLHFTSFDNLRSVLFENAIVRKIFDLKVYSGNSVEHALHGHSLAHRLSYYEYGEMYLQGHGVGSCYIAELYHDFGLIGVMLGSFFYGYVLKKINNIQFENYLGDGILIAMIYYLILAPRGNFDGFIGGVFSLYSVFGIVMICIITKFVIWTHMRDKK